MLWLAYETPSSVLMHILSLFVRAFLESFNWMLYLNVDLPWMSVALFNVLFDKRVSIWSLALLSSDTPTAPLCNGNIPLLSIKLPAIMMPSLSWQIVLSNCEATEFLYSLTSFHVFGSIAENKITNPCASSISFFLFTK